MYDAKCPPWGQKCIVAKIGEKLQRDFTSSALLRYNGCK